MIEEVVLEFRTLVMDGGDAEAKLRKLLSTYFLFGSDAFVFME